MIAMINKSVARIVVILLLISLSAIEVKVADANPETSTPNLSMPVEYINYTITDINGTLWAKIDGNYPIYLQKQMDCTFTGDLPMVYPMPPQTTNIHVSLDGKEVSWCNYTQSYPNALHHTAIGDWWMIYINPMVASNHFMLKIHYEHPLEKINNSYFFLYDLNISPYLSLHSTNSSAYFQIEIRPDFTDLRAFNTETDSKWNPVMYNLTKTNSSQIVAIEEYSEYGKPLLGDLIVEFSLKQVPKFPSAAFAVVVAGAIAIAGLLVYFKRHQRSGHYYA